MLIRHKHKKITWVDLETPTQEEVRGLMKEFNIHPLVANELLSPTIRPKVDLYNNLIYVILHFPAFKHAHGAKSQQEVDFIIGKNFILTTHYEMIDQLHEFSRIFEVNSIIDKSHIGDHAGFLFYYIARELYRVLGAESDCIEDSLERIEDRIFNGDEIDMVQELSRVSRDILNFRQAIRMHKDVLKSLESAGEHFFGAKFIYYLRSLTGEYHKIESSIESNRDTLVELRETNDSLLTTKQNETMKVLTIMAFVTLPLSLVATIFGMNTAHTPIVGMKWDFWIVIAIMTSSVLLMIWYFKNKNWL